MYFDNEQRPDVVSRRQPISGGIPAALWSPGPSFASNQPFPACMVRTVPFEGPIISSPQRLRGSHRQDSVRLVGYTWDISCHDRLTDQPTHSQTSVLPSVPGQEAILREVHYSALVQKLMSDIAGVSVDACASLVSSSRAEWLSCSKSSALTIVIHTALTVRSSRSIYSCEGDGWPSNENDERRRI